MPPKQVKKGPATASRRPRSQAVVERDFLSVAYAGKAWHDRKSDGICGACLLGVEDDSQVGLLDNCTHVFHFDCIQRWSQTENSCPQCKVRFFWLAAYRPNGKRANLKRVEKKDQENEDEDSFEEVFVCEKCKDTGDESTLLLCDGMHGTCNACFHTTCVGLTEVPKGSWFCPDCTERGFDIDAQGRRGKRPAPADQSEEQERPNTPAASAVSQQEGAGNDVAASEPSAGAAALPIRRVQQRTSLPPQLRLSSMACVTPAVEGPSFRRAGAAGGGGTETSDEPQQPQGLFASFAQRRKARRGDAAKPAEGAGGGSFISLTPVYEDDFMGGKALR